jgi:Pyruvate/2-oxoacid:ferredoxin oxidoreductase delta subunit
MCEFCVEHGEGKVWYLEAANHSREMMDTLRVEELMRRHAGTFETSSIRLYTIYDRLSPLWKFAPFKRLAHGWATRRQKKKHFGQVLPREHVHRVFELAASIVRLPCVCRRFVKGRPEARYCLGLGFDPHKVYAGLPEYKGDFERLTAAEASNLVDSFEREEGLLHTVWTMPTPFIGAVCNCSHEDCGAMLTHYRLGINVLFPGELKAAVDPDRCTGCRRCLRACPFQAIVWDATPGKARVIAHLCQGCGLCRQACAAGAMALVGPAADHDHTHEREPIIHAHR